MASKASRDPITPEPFWFLNPQLGRLAILEHRFVTQWIHDDGAAADWIQNLLISGWLPWHAGVEIDYLDIRTGPITTLPGTVLRWFWQIRHCTPIEWNSSSTIYVGPSILTGKDPDGFEYPITDGRSRVRIKLSLIRFYHPVLEYRLRSAGLMPWPAPESKFVPSSAPMAPPAAQEASPPQFSTASIPASSEAPETTPEATPEERIATFLAWARDQYHHHVPKRKFKWIEAVAYPRMRKELGDIAPWDSAESLKRAMYPSKDGK